MKNKFLFSYLLIAIFLTGFVKSQNISVPELLHIHFDKDFYLAGEDVWYTVYFTSPQYQQSEIVHVELFGPQGQLIRKQLLKVSDGKAVGDFALSPSLREGYYHFRAYTKFNLNFQPQAIFSRQIPVFEFNSGDRVADNTQAEDKATQPITEAVGGVKINTPKNTFSPREDINISVSLDSPVLEEGSASVSIVNRKYVDENALPNITKSQPDIRDYRFDPTKKIEVEKDMYRSFRILNPVTQGPVRSSFIAGYVKQTKQRIISQTMDGTVRVRFDAFYDSSIVQLFDANPFVVEYSPIVSEIGESIPVDPPEILRELPPVTPEVAGYIDFYKKRFHLNNLFGNLSNMRAGQPDIKEAELTPTFTYNVDDFIEFKDTYTFIRESIKAFKIKKYGQYIVRSNKNASDALNALLQKLPTPNYYFRLYLPGTMGRQKSAKRNPLIIVNDYLTYNADAVLRMNVNNLKSIEVFSDITNLPLQFGPIGNYGVIKFETKNGETSSEIANTTNNLKIEGFYLPREFSVPKPEGFEKGVSRIPNLRPMMYWNPELKLNSNVPAEITIPASDIPGDYIIRIEGIKTNGTPFYVEYPLTVQVINKAD